MIGNWIPLTAPSVARGSGESGAWDEAHYSRPDSRSVRIRSQPRSWPRRCRRPRRSVPGVRPGRDPCRSVRKIRDVAGARRLAWDVSSNRSPAPRPPNPECDVRYFRTDHDAMPTFVVGMCSTARPRKRTCVAMTPAANGARRNGNRFDTAFDVITMTDLGGRQCQEPPRSRPRPKENYRQ